MKKDKKRFMSWQKEIISYFWPFLKTDKRYLFLLGVISLITIASNTLLIWMIGRVITLITSSDFEPLNYTLIIIAGIVLFNIMIQFVYTYNYQRATLRFIDRVRGKFLSQIMRLSFPVFFKFEKGDLLARLSGDVDRLLIFIFNLPLNLVAAFSVLTVYSGMIFWINWQLALIALFMAPLFFFSQYFVGPKTGQISKAFTQEKAKLLSLEEQSLSNLKGISAFNSEDFIRQKHRKQFITARSWALKLRMIRLLYNSIFTVLLYLVAVVLIYSGIAKIQTGELELGIFVSFLIYIRFLTNPVRNLARMPIQMQTNRIAADRIMEVLELIPESAELNQHSPLKVSHGKIHFENVSFHYPGNENPVFSNLNITVEAGETVALVGTSGTGKSTFAGLLLRFYNPQHGLISIDEADIKNVSLKSLRDQISIVWQEPLIINGTIEENLRLAKPDATRQQLESACQSAHAWEFIEKLEHGFDTLLGTHGLSLSVGQQQRISIAQAFLRDSPILILDEATSALDSYSEQKLVEAIETLRNNRTTLIIAHRFSSIRTANRVIYFKGDGEVTAGTHEQLLEQLPDYKNAVEWQLGKIKNEEQNFS